MYYKGLFVIKEPTFCITAWIERDSAAEKAASFTSTPGNKEMITSPQDVTELKKEAA